MFVFYSVDDGVNDDDDVDNMNMTQYDMPAISGPDYLRHFNFADTSENVLNEEQIFKNDEESYCFNEISFDKQEMKKKMEVIEETDKDCPGRHGLVESQASDTTVMECSECDKIMFLKERLFGCKWCDYNLCVQCYKGENNQNEDAENDHAEADNLKDFDECKTMRSEEFNEDKSKTTPIVNALPPKQTKNDKKRPREENKAKSPPSKKRRKITIKIPRLRKKKVVTLKL